MFLLFHTNSRAAHAAGAINAASFLQIEGLRKTPGYLVQLNVSVM